MGIEASRPLPPLPPPPARREAASASAFFPPPTTNTKEVGGVVGEGEEETISFEHQSQPRKQQQQQQQQQPPKQHHSIYVDKDDDPEAQHHHHHQEDAGCFILPYPINVLLFGASAAAAAAGGGGEEEEEEEYSTMNHHHHQCCSLEVFSPEEKGRRDDADVDATITDTTTVQQRKMMIPIKKNHHHDPPPPPAAELNLMLLQEKEEDEEEDANKTNTITTTTTCESMDSTWSFKSSMDHGAAGSLTTTTMMMMMIADTDAATTTSTTTTTSTSTVQQQQQKQRTKRKNRIVDVYQTDCTLLQEEDRQEDWYPLVVGRSNQYDHHDPHQPRLQLPFRSCRRRRCYCKVTRHRHHHDQNRNRNGHQHQDEMRATTTTTAATLPSASKNKKPSSSSETNTTTNNNKSNTNSNHTKPKNVERFLQENAAAAAATTTGATSQPQQQQPHRRQLSDDLEGLLWIPSPSQEQQVTMGEDNSNTGGGGGSGAPPPHREEQLLWMVKSHSERNVVSFLSGGDEMMMGQSSTAATSAATSATTPTGRSTTRIRAVSEDLALQQQPRVFFPSPTTPTTSCIVSKRTDDHTGDDDDADDANQDDDDDDDDDLKSSTSAVSSSVSTTTSASTATTCSRTSMISSTPMARATALRDDEEEEEDDDDDTDDDGGDASSIGTTGTTANSSCSTGTEPQDIDAEEDFSFQQQHERTPLPSTTRTLVDSQDHYCYSHYGTKTQQPTTDNVAVPSPAARGVITPSTTTTTNTTRKNAHVYRRLRSRSEDIIDMQPATAASFARASKANHNHKEKSGVSAPNYCCHHQSAGSHHRHRQRARSEDVVDQQQQQQQSRSANEPRLPTELVVEPPISDHDSSRSLGSSSSQCSSHGRRRHGRARSYSRENVIMLGTPPSMKRHPGTANTAAASSDDEHSFKNKKPTPPSPTSILDVHEAVTSTIATTSTTTRRSTAAAAAAAAETVLETLPKVPSCPTTRTTTTASSSSRLFPPCEHLYQTQLQELRRSVNQMLRRHEQQERQQDKQNVIELYHGIACLHFQHCRYDAALCVVNHALERLYLTQGSTSQHDDAKATSATTPGDTSRSGKQRCGCLTLAETMDCADDSIKPLLGDLLVTKARILLSSSNPTSTAAAGNSSNIMVPSGDNVDPSIHEAKYLAKTAVSLVRPFMNNQQPSSPELVTIVAKGLSVLGRAYSRKGFGKPGVAMGHFQQALSMFRFVSQQQRQQEQKGSMACTIWIAETMSHLGNLHLDEGLLDLTKESYWEALRLYRFVYQQEALAAARSTPISTVLVDMATTLTNLGWVHLLEHDLALAHRSTMEALWLLQNYHGHQDGASSTLTAASLRNLASVEFQLGMIASRGGQPAQALAFWKTALGHQQVAFRVDHVDIAITMEAIGSSYQQLYQWSKARTFLEGAIEVRKRAAGNQGLVDIARIQSRLALVLLEMNQIDRARRVLSKASKRYQHGSLPMDDLGCQARLWLAQISRREDDRLNA